MNVLLVSLPEGTSPSRATRQQRQYLLNPDATSSVSIRVIASSAVSLPLVQRWSRPPPAFILVVSSCGAERSWPAPNGRGGNP